MKLAVKALWISLAWLLGWTLFYLLNLQTAYSADGKAIFQKYKCQSCHTVTSQGIAKEKQAVVAEEDAEDEEEKVEPPDLSDICSGKVESKIDWTKDLEGWILKTKANKDEKKHKKLFKGTPEERKMLVDWLVALCPSK
ncbi:MAG: c-type cytochrome [Deltaproteobacteria bacterium]|nr:c-type cytochrome [Deltaproteobacteria bacterium]